MTSASRVKNREIAGETGVVRFLAMALNAQTESSTGGCHTIMPSQLVSTS
jgi:hypothetical protein